MRQKGLAPDVEAEPAENTEKHPQRGGHIDRIGGGRAGHLGKPDEDADLCEEVSASRCKLQVGEGGVELGPEPAPLDLPKEQPREHRRPEQRNVLECVARGGVAIGTQRRATVEIPPVGAHLAPETRVARPAVAGAILAGLPAPEARAGARSRCALVEHVRVGGEAPHAGVEHHRGQRGGVERAPRQRVARPARLLAGGDFHRVTDRAGVAFAALGVGRDRGGACGAQKAAGLAILGLVGPRDAGRARDAGHVGLPAAGRARFARPRANRRLEKATRACRALCRCRPVLWPDLLSSGGTGARAGGWVCDEPSGASDLNLESAKGWRGVDPVGFVDAEREDQAGPAKPGGADDGDVTAIAAADHLYGELGSGGKLD
mmetsp:Transcript_1746/g.5754  ORF Transcript_1746/g.5754 Transcript_1746/m.5754 type:complete len:375 (+) Transcript_1746:953-2077(+)